MEFKLGIRVREVVSGFEGIVTGRCEYLNGCVQYLVRPRIKADEPHKVPDGHWFDEQYLETVDDGLLAARHPAALRAAAQDVRSDDGLLPVTDAARVGPDQTPPSAPSHG